MSPILVRPVREQLEHDRIIRLLQAKFRRKYEAGMNPGGEAERAGRHGADGAVSRPRALSQERGHRLQAIVEVETGESVNHLEALAQWAHFGRLRAAFHLYVPSGMVDVARRLCDDNHIHVTEIWSYHAVGDELRFTLVHRSREAQPAAPREKAGAPRRHAAAAAKKGRKAAPRRALRQAGAAEAAARAAKAPPAGEAPTREDGQAVQSASKPWRFSGSRATSAATRTSISSSRRRAAASRATASCTGSARRPA